ncbi:NSS family neurotransmitter:Na+ symporter [Scopulibacillus darangshiensis]|uniref:NSS family neurotransmitter:Na+ symporter n=1 Tax=Scopulibacillus darangshiensis TaxID=442528 RepID=A0A4R2P4H4_9BACL|nr:sodium-dependent transporter [Scopulibacillus darangshiensis]TCP28954.1 NSS family neurotransmitter:Na+ symporter [Scopulibacillus darangshiensis]
MSQQREQWTSKLGFILAASGSAIGLGAIWKFPYVAGTTGGGAFFLIFLLFTLLIGLPILLAEFIIGRGSQKDAISAYKFFAPGTNWNWIGKMGVVSSFILLSFYSVVGGWVLIYLFEAITGGLNGLGNNDYGKLFNDLIADPAVAVGGQLLFMLITVFVVAQGIKKGIERASQVMMPALFIAFIILIVRSLTLSEVGKGIEFFLYPDFSGLDSKTILFALGQSFFALSVGISVMVTYSSYLSKNESLPKSATLIVIMNVVISLLAGLAIFPAVFSFGFEPAEGPGLLFVVLPAVFNEMPFGMFFLVIFLLLFLFATLTSAFSMLEIIVAALTKGNTDKRKKVSWIAGIIIFIIGVPSALSYGVLGDFKIGGKIIFDQADFLVSNILLPLGALAISIFVTLKIPRKRLLEEFTAGTSKARKWFAAWFLIIRYIVPIAIIIVFLDVTGVLDMIGL